VHIFHPIEPILFNGRVNADGHIIQNFIHC
jgi:hypothetical protein